MPDAQAEWIDRILRLMPRGIRFGANDADRFLPAAAGEHVPFRRSTEETVTAFDPSEAISGHRLETALAARFIPVEIRNAGGTLTTYLQPYLDYRLAGQPPYDRWMLWALDLEEALIHCGVLSSDYRFVVFRRT